MPVTNGFGGYSTSRRGYIYIHIYCFYQIPSRRRITNQFICVVVEWKSLIYNKKFIARRLRVLPPSVRNSATVTYIDAIECTLILLVYWQRFWLEKRYDGYCLVFVTIENYVYALSLSSNVFWNKTIFMNTHRNLFDLYLFIRRRFMVICCLMYSLTTSVFTVQLMVTLHVLSLIYTYLHKVLSLLTLLWSEI